MGKKNAHNKTIGDIVKKVIKTLRSKKGVTEEEIVKAWGEAVGRQAAGHTRPVSVRRSVLMVNVDDSGWLYELTTKKRDILKKLEGRMGAKPLKGLRLRIGEIKK
ncbi:MAG: DUF721 domain-containing protein [Candidatus Omnitrophota bacterium]